MRIARPAVNHCSVAASTCYLLTIKCAVNIGTHDLSVIGIMKLIFSCSVNNEPTLIILCTWYVEFLENLSAVVNVSVTRENVFALPCELWKQLKSHFFAAAHNVYWYLLLWTVCFYDCCSAPMSMLIMGALEMHVIIMIMLMMMWNASLALYRNCIVSSSRDIVVKNNNITLIRRTLCRKTEHRSIIFTNYFKM